MFVSERLDKIINLINEQGKVEVNKLSKHFKVSKDLIRKDLSKLEEQGLLERTYGGAVKKRQLAKTITIASRISENIHVKETIAKKALKEIKENELIYLDISSINYLFAQEIIKNNIEVTIITNMIDIMHLFSLNSQIKTKLIGIGGACNNIIDGFVGIESMQQIKKFNIDRCFIGAIGVNILNGNISTFDQEDGLTKAAIIQSSRRRYLITEKSKIEQDGRYIFSNLQDFQFLLTDNDLEASLKKELKLFNIRII